MYVRDRQRKRERGGVARTKEKQYHTRRNSFNLIRKLGQPLTAAIAAIYKRASGPTSEVWHFESDHLAHLSVHLQVAPATKPRSMLSSFPRRGNCNPIHYTRYMRYMRRYIRSHLQLCTVCMTMKLKPRNNDGVKRPKLKNFIVQNDRNGRNSGEINVHQSRIKIYCHAYRQFFS